MKNSSFDKLLNLYVFMNKDKYGIVFRELPAFLVLNIFGKIQFAFRS